jgi:hypothetical protein
MLTPTGDYSRLDLFLFWLLLAVSTLAGLTARLAQRVFDVSQIPPDDERELRSWHLKRRWMIASELAAVPAFATGWIAAWMYWRLNVPFVILGSMCTGALGFGFMINALQTIVSKRIGP